MVVRQLSPQTFERLALSEPKRKWEMHRGQLREKPAMSTDHGDILTYLSHFLIMQLDGRAYRVRANHGRLRRGHDSYYIPDVSVVPRDYVAHLRGQPHRLEVVGQPVPFVAEVWSPSTGDYDVDSKLPEYRARGDREIWRIHPYERTLIAWRRLADGSYEESTYGGGVVEVASLPRVTIDLDRLFDWT